MIASAISPTLPLPAIVGKRGARRSCAVMTCKPRPGRSNTGRLNRGNPGTRSAALATRSERLDDVPGFQFATVNSFSPVEILH
jgi:hypothetical protein